MFGTPVRVHPMFWLLSAIFGWSWSHLGFEYLLLWIICTFISILVHEFGHVFAGRWFGRESYVVLYSFGGLAIGSNDLPWRWQRVVVSLAGPAAGFLLWGLIFLLNRYALPHLDLPPGAWPYVAAVIIMLLFMNLYWSLLNLLPIWPLDGGKVSREILGGIFPGRGIRYSLALSLVVAGVLAVHCLLGERGIQLLPWLPVGGLYAALLFALLAVESFQLLQEEARNRSYWSRDDSTPWERDPTIWRR
jgi:Zn-dependent protease